jgi:hypothetical protein
MHFVLCSIHHLSFLHRHYRIDEQIAFALEQLIVEGQMDVMMMELELKMNQPLIYALVICHNYQNHRRFHHLQIERRMYVYWIVFEDLKVKYSLYYQRLLKKGIFNRTKMINSYSSFYVNVIVK